MQHDLQAHTHRFTGTDPLSNVPPLLDSLVESLVSLQSTELPRALPLQDVRDIVMVTVGFQGELGYDILPVIPAVDVVQLKIEDQLIVP